MSKIDVDALHRDLIARDEFEDLIQRALALSVDYLSHGMGVSEEQSKFFIERLLEERFSEARLKRIANEVNERHGYDTKELALVYADLFQRDVARLMMHSYQEKQVVPKSMSKTTQSKQRLGLENWMTKGTADRRELMPKTYATLIQPGARPEQIREWEAASKLDKEALAYQKKAKETRGGTKGSTAKAVGRRKKGGFYMP